MVMAKDRRRHREEHVIKTGVFLFTVPGKYTYKVRAVDVETFQGRLYVGGNILWMYSGMYPGVYPGIYGCAAISTRLSTRLSTPVCNRVCIQVHTWVCI